MEQVIPAVGSAPLKLWTTGVDVEATAWRQLTNVAALPIVSRRGVAVMPDCHWGRGATVGSVIPTVGAIVPSAVGVDIGCGLIAQQTALMASDLPDSLGNVRSAIEAAVPHGRTNHGGAYDKGAWGDVPPAMATAWRELLAPSYDALLEQYPRLKRANAVKHLGSLGTGNHFIEVCLDEQQHVWVMLHSGSRGIGNAIGTLFIELAQRDTDLRHIALPDRDLAYLTEGTPLFADYVKAVGWAQTFAWVNRRLMLERTLRALGWALGRPVGETETTAINCHHNYVQQETHFGESVWLTRKGAVSARLGEVGIIPGSMGAQSFIVRGKGNVDSYHSCAHGAGRQMSRTQAKQTFTLADHIAATAGVECRKDAGVLDETPGAYKPIAAVMAAQADLVEVVAVLKQVVCVKG